MSDSGHGEDVLVFAHRGSSEAMPEHTLDAYRRAIDEGADGLECDVRLTRDGHLICIHDRRLDRTSDGRGLVSAHTLVELRRLDFGSWHQRGGANGVLTLETLLGLACDAGRELRLLVETKHPSRFGAQVEQRLVELLDRHGLAIPKPHAPVSVSVMSFSPGAVRRMRQLAPDLPTVFLFELAPPQVRTGRAPFGAGAFGPSVAALRAHPLLPKRAHDRGNQVYVWTANEPADVDLAVRLGVDGIITDRPAQVLKRIGRG